MKNVKKKRGFTIVELVIVIAVIAILAAVLIPTFSNVIRRSKISADTQLCRNLNTVLTMATSEGRVPTSMYDVLYLVSESGYLLGNLNPTAEGYYFAWDSQGQKIVYVREDLNTVIYPEDYTIDKSKCWITVADQAEAQRVAAAGYNLYLERNIETIELSNVAVSIDTGAFRIGTLKIDGEVADQKSVVLSGNFGTTNLDIKNTSFSTTGSISSLNVGSNTAAMTINGNVGTVSSSIANTTMSQTGAIGSITSGTVTAGSTTFTNTSTGKITGAVDGIVSVGTKEAIENIRQQLASGRTFENETIKISNDINMAGIAFQPLSNYARETSGTKNLGKETWFQGEFDGQGHTIKNFSTNGFAISGLNAGTNGSSQPFGGVTYNEAVYGLLGTIYVPAGETVTIKNLNIEVSVDMVIDDANQYVGDSVGALIGYVYGSGTLNIKNVTISGVVNGYDSVGAFIGRAYNEGAAALTINFENCTNNATVTGIRKTGAFIGYTDSTINFEKCVNNAKITCKGIKADQALGATKNGNPVTGTNGTGYYAKGLYVGSNSKQYVAPGDAITGGTTVTVTGVTNNGSFGAFDE